MHMAEHIMKFQDGQLMFILKIMELQEPQVKEV